MQGGQKHAPADSVIGSISLVLRVPEHVIFSSSHFFFFGVECSISSFIFLFCVCFSSVCFFFLQFFFVLGTAGLDKLRLISRYYNISTLYI